MVLHQCQNQNVSAIWYTLLSGICARNQVLSDLGPTHPEAAVQLQAAGHKSCCILNPVELFTMTFQADSKWQDATPSKLKKQYDKDKQVGDGMDPKAVTQFYASLADKYFAPSQFTYWKKVLLFEDAKTIVLQSKVDAME